MSEITRILEAAGRGDPNSARDLLPLVYDELRKLAASKMSDEKPGQTLETTALVHEAYLRLVGPGECQHWDHRGHFFAAAAEAMRRILVENARRKKTRKHGGGLIRQAGLEAIPGATALDPADILAVHEGLEALATKSPRRAELVKLRYFLGFTMSEAAQVLGVAISTAEDDWAYAKAWLRRRWLRDVRKNSSANEK
jgi:RNA polymerase sigma factor (TIGR02999 family)